MDISEQDGESQLQAAQQQVSRRASRAVAAGRRDQSVRRRHMPPAAASRAIRFDPHHRAMRHRLLELFVRRVRGTFPRCSFVWHIVARDAQDPEA